MSGFDATSRPRPTLEHALLPEVPPIPVDALFEEMSEQELADWEQGGTSDPLRTDRL